MYFCFPVLFWVSQPWGSGVYLVTHMSGNHKRRQKNCVKWLHYIIRWGAEIWFGTTVNIRAAEANVSIELVLIDTKPKIKSNLVLSGECGHFVGHVFSTVSSFRLFKPFACIFFSPTQHHYCQLLHHVNVCICPPPQDHVKGVTWGGASRPLAGKQCPVVCEAL